MKRKLIWQFDLLVYRLFYWRWNSRLIGDERLFRMFKRWMDEWESRHL